MLSELLTSVADRILLRRDIGDAQRVWRKRIRSEAELRRRGSRAPEPVAGRR